MKIVPRLLLESERVDMSIPRHDEDFAGGNDRLAVVYPARDDLLAGVQLLARLRVKGKEDEVAHRRGAKLGCGLRRRCGLRGPSLAGLCRRASASGSARRRINPHVSARSNAVAYATLSPQNADPY